MQKQSRPMISLPSIVNHQNALAVRDQGLAKITKEGIVDASHLEEFDSSIIAVLLAWNRINPQLAIQGAPEKLQVLSKVYGLEEVFQLKKANE
ncbi:MAG: STAS domain-containing protein [Betaproteobacteria bacterium]